MGIDDALMDSNFPSFTISKVELEGISKILKSRRVTDLQSVVIEDTVCNEFKPTLHLNMMSVEGVGMKAGSSSSGICQTAENVEINNTSECERDFRQNYLSNFRQNNLEFGQHNNLQKVSHNKSWFMGSGQQNEWETGES